MYVILAVAHVITDGMSNKYVEEGLCGDDWGRWMRGRKAGVVSCFGGFESCKVGDESCEEKVEDRDCGCDG